MTTPTLLHARYEPGAELGRGAQGVVLRVVDREAPERALVAKVWLSGRFSASTLEGEFALLRRLDIPGLVRAHDFGRDARTGVPFFVEDFVEGEPASSFIAQAGAARAEHLARVLAEVATTLAALHEAAFVHGDLKPEHVRVTRQGRVFLLDLGAAVMQSGAAPEQGAVLTRAFAAPELLSGGRSNALSDLYALGALGVALATGAPPHVARAKLRVSAPWVPPSISDLLERLLQPHPRDRPESAEAVLAALGLAGVHGSRRHVPAPVGREQELTALAAPAAGVRYLTGPSGVGKSHLLREVVTRALLTGRAARRLAFPASDSLVVAELVAFLRGESAAWPFLQQRSESAPLLLALDDLQAAPAELVTALDAYRCRPQPEPGLDIIATLRLAPPGSSQVRLAPLANADFRELCGRLGVTDGAHIAELQRSTGNNPGWLVAAHGRVPLSRDMVLERTRGLGPNALQLLASVALFGGTLERSLARGLDSDVGELLAAGLLTRNASCYALLAPELAADVASALGSFDLAERLATRALAEPTTPPRALLALAGSAFPTAEREALLVRAAERAGQIGLAEPQIEALLALCANPARRSAELLTRLERLTRSAGSPHPQVLQWLSDAAEREPTVAPLALRRQADRAARAGNFELAETRSSEAHLRAQELGDGVGAALALATRGAVALFRADVSSAETALRDARAQLATLHVTDLEELARVDHNVGVVALYQDRAEDAAAAFERSLGIKRKLGDRAGVRSCLLNLGLAQARLGQYEHARTTLTEAHALAQALEQHAGRAWCLAARADVELRAGDAQQAERFIAEAAAISQAPPSVRADLSLLRGQVALLRGDAQQARAALKELDSPLRGSDAMVDARATLVEAGALLVQLPAEPRAAARLAIQVVRQARSAKLSEVATQAVALLRRARQKDVQAASQGYTPTMADAEAKIWRWLAEAATSASPEASLTSLLNLLRDASAAERAFAVACNADGAAASAWGVDLDGFSLPSALDRCDLDLVHAAFEAKAPHYLRDVPTPAGRGSRLALPAPGAPYPNAVLVLEQRFRTGNFDALSAEASQRFGVLVGLAVRLTSPAAAAVAPALPPRALPTSETGFSTALPLGEPRRHFANIVGSSRALRSALARLDAAVDSELPVLIIGQTGTGKELFARALHEHGAGANAPFVAVNCAAIPDALFEAELFGHARGAFTGADKARAGLLSRAQGGTLFLDEIGELPPARQATLLRVLEARRFRPVGSDEERTCDARVVAATNRDLETEVANGTFRQDLLYRINVVELRVPSLRDRSEDIPALLQAFLARAGSHVAFSAEAISALEKYAWPGNVRELEHQVQRLLTLGLSRIEVAQLPRALRQGVSARTTAYDADRSDAPEPGTRAELQRALADANGNITHAARALGLTRHGLKKRMLRLGLRSAASGGGEP